MHTHSIRRVQLLYQYHLHYIDTYIVSLYQGLSTSLILAGDEGLAGDNLNDLEQEDSWKGVD
jgi:hypothetical protein